MMLDFPVDWAIIYVHFSQGRDKSRTKESDRKEDIENDSADESTVSLP